MRIIPEAVKNIRVIPRLDVKAPNVVKGIHLEGLRVVGKPDELARKYYEDGADEILYMDIVASLYGRNNLVEIVEKASEEIFVPLTVGGGIRTLDDIHRLLRAGADKVAINTAATKNPSLITEAAKRFGAQCIVISIEAKAVAPGKWEAYTDNGREKTGLDVVHWVKQAQDLGAGEILVTSVDREGTKKGYDLELIKRLSSLVQIPLIACGGAGKLEDVAAAALEGQADAVSIASLLHYESTTITEVKRFLFQRGIEVRSAY